MTIATFLARRRRMLAICGASALLHAMAIWWVSTELGGGARPEQDPVPQTVEAILLAPPPPSSAPPAPATSVRQPAAPPAPAPEPQQLAEPAAPPPEPAALEAPVEAVAETPLPEPDLAPEAVALDGTMMDPAPAEPEAPRYRVNLPPSTRLSFEVARRDKSGTEWRGSSEMHWQRGQGSYRLSMDASVNMLVTRVSVGTVTSEGTITQDGIVPRRVLEKRMGRAQTATHFNAEEGRITFSTREHSAPLLAGAQDKASVQFQLAGIARADSAQLAAGVEIQVGSERDAAPYRFVVAGEEEIETPMGRLATWRLARAPRPGSYSARLEIWLAPQHGWLPVKVRSTEANGAVTTQTIRKIVTTESASE